MKPEKPEEIIEMISELLRKNNLFWIVDEVKLQIESGKLVEEEIYSSERYDSISGKMVPTRARKEKLVKTIPYSAQEQIEIFLNAIKVAISSSLKMRDGIWENLPRDTPGSIEFRAEKSDADNFEIEKSDRGVARDDAVKLTESVDDFLKYLKNNGGENAN